MTRNEESASAPNFASAPSLDGWSCPVPLRDYERIVIGHGGGGKLSAELIEHLFLPAFGSNGVLTDSVELELGLEPGERVVMSTDSYVVRPLFFAGGSIGELAINGTINDLAMSGARPVALSAGFILMEGQRIDELAFVAQAMGDAARAAGVPIVTGDTKVVDSHDPNGGILINTAGVGIAPAGGSLSPSNVTPGDRILVSGSIGDHAVAIMSEREGLEFGGPITSDTAALYPLVAALQDGGVELHCLRDPTRGGVATSLNEVASTANVGIAVEESALPVRSIVAAACSFLGLDPMELANEGKLLAFVPEDDVERALKIVRQHPLGSEAAIIGRVVDEHRGVVAATTPLGAVRVVDTPLGEALPRIC